MDHWDPAFVNPLATKRPVILIDNSGVGRSGGEIPKEFGAWAENYVKVLQRLGLARVDVLGYSMGGCVAQLVALDAPTLVRRLVLCSTMPSTGDGVVSAEREPFNSLRNAETLEQHKDVFLSVFFTRSESGLTAAAAAWERMLHARPDKANYVSQEGTRRQVSAFAKFMDPRQAGKASFNRLHELKLPVLIATGQAPKSLHDAVPTNDASREQ